MLASPEAASAFLAVRVLVTPELTPLPRRRRVPPTVLLGPVLGGVCALGMLLLGLVAAQDPAKPETQTPSAAERMQELDALQQKAVADWRADNKKAKEDREAGRESARALRMRPDFGPVAEKALAYAKEFQGKDEAVDFLLMVVNLDQRRARPALETLLKDKIGVKFGVEVNRPGALDDLTQTLESRAIAAGTRLATDLLDPLVETFGPLHIRSAYRRGEWHSMAKEQLVAPAS